MRLPLSERTLYLFPTRGLLQGTSVITFSWKNIGIGKLRLVASRSHGLQGVLEVSAMLAGLASVRPE
jgi:hypothetical protein